MTSKKLIRKKIAHFGAFDHDSYGDLIFPHIVEYLLPEFEFVHISPSGRDTPWSDAKKTISTDEAFKIKDWDGVLVGGGDIIQTSEGFIWNESAIQSLGALGSLWCGASLLSAEQGIPCAWNSPGVPFELADSFLSMAHDSIRCVDYLSVRDEFSKTRINRFSQKPVYIIPDTALLISEIWKKPRIQGHKKKPLVLSLTANDIDNRIYEIEQLVQQVTMSDQFSDEVIVLPLMRWMTSSAENKLDHLTRKYNIKIKNKNLTLREAAKVLSTAGGYVGNSLHGLITAISYGIPAVHVHPLGFNNTTKYKGFEKIIQSEDKILATSYIEASNLLFSNIRIDISESAQSIKGHFENIRQILGENKSNKKRLWNQISTTASSEARNLLLHGYSPNQLINKRSDGLNAFNEEIRLLSLALTARDEQIASLSNEVSSRTSQLEQLNNTLTARDEQIASLSNSIQTMQHSYSWLLTKPLRLISSQAMNFKISLGASFNRIKTEIPLFRKVTIRLIKQSSLFDEVFYKENYPDVLAERIDPAKHYCLSGWKEHRNPSAKFNTAKYLEAHADVAAARINPLLHFIKHGKAEGRKIQLADNDTWQQPEDRDTSASVEGSVGCKLQGQPPIKIIEDPKEP